MNEKTVAMVTKMAGVPYHYSVLIEYDREVVTVRLYDLWKNTVVVEAQEGDTTAHLMVEQVYKTYLEMEKQNEQK